MKRTVPGVVARAGDVARRLGITRGLRQRLPRWGAECGPDETRVLLVDALFHYTSRLCVGGCFTVSICAQSIEGDVSNRLSNLKLL